MITTGKIQACFPDYKTRKWMLQIECDNYIGEDVERLKNDVIKLEITKYRNKRSLDANAYYWVLVGKIAEVKNLSNSEVHNLMLRDYGTVKTTDGRIWYAVIPDDEDEKVLQDDKNHLRPTSQVKVGKDGKVWRTYQFMKGSSEYDTKEMSRLIDGAVQEAKQLDIETLPPEELMRMKEEWK